MHLRQTKADNRGTQAQSKPSLGGGQTTAGPTEADAGRILALQRSAGNRAVVRHLARQPTPTKDKPKVAAPAEVAAAGDPLNYDRFPGWWWWGIGPDLDAPADESKMRQILVAYGNVNAKALKESTATLIKPPGDRAYWSFRHAKLGVVARAFSSHTLGVVKSTDPSAKIKRPYRLFIYTNRGGGEPLVETDVDALSPEIEDTLGGKKRVEAFKKKDPAQLLRIAELLSALTSDELKLFHSMAMLTDDLDAIEKSLEAFTKMRDKQLREAAATKAKAKGTSKEKTLEEQLEETWAGVDAKKWAGMNRGQREAKAREVASEQAKKQLKHMVTNPGETAKNMVKGVVRVDQVTKGIYEDLKEAASGDKGKFQRWAGGMGATAKLSGWLAAVAGIAYLVMLFIPGVNVALLATTALALGVTALIASSVETELRIQAAADAPTFEEAKVQTGKGGAALANVLAGVATMVVAGSLKIIAKTPIPGKLKTVGGALDAAKSALKSKTAPAFTAARDALLAKLRGARQGMPESLESAVKAFQEQGKQIGAMSGSEMLDRLAKGDKMLEDLTGISPTDAKQIQQLAKTPAGADVPDLLKAGVMEELRSAPVEARQQVQKIAGDLDRTIKAVEGAKSADELARVVDDAQPKLAPDKLAADADSAVVRWAADPDLGERLFKGSPKKAPPAPTKPPPKKPTKDPDARVPVSDKSKAKQSGEPVTSKTPPRSTDEPDVTKGSGKDPPAQQTQPPVQTPPKTPEPSVLEKLDARVEKLRSKRPALEKDVAVLRGREQAAKARLEQKERQVRANKDKSKAKELEDERALLEEKWDEAYAEMRTLEKAIEKLDQHVKRDQEAIRAELARLEKAVSENVPRLVWPEQFTKEKRRPLLGRSGESRPGAVTVTKVPLSKPGFKERLREILKKAESNPQAAGNEFARLIGEHEGWMNLSERFGKEHGQIGRRWDFGNTKEVTIEGRGTKGFGEKKLDQFWFDLNEYGGIDLTVPRLSPKAKADLARLAGEWERWNPGKRATILVREVGE